MNTRFQIYDYDKLITGRDNWHNIHYLLFCIKYDFLCEKLQTINMISLKGDGTLI